MIEAYNPAAELIFGYSAEEAIRQSLNLIVPINQKDEHARYIKDSDLHAPKIIHRERELNGLHKSGKLIPIELTPISQVAPIFSILKLRFCYKNQYVEAYTGH